MLRLQDNRYPESIFVILFRQKTARVNSKLKEVPKECSVYLKLFCFSKIFFKFGNQVKSTDSKATFEPRVIISTLKKQKRDQQFVKISMDLAMITVEC